MLERKRNRAALLVAAALVLVVLAGRLDADTGTCGGASFILPFSDVHPASPFFCAIAEAFFTGLTNGTSQTTYSPSDPVAREQMAAFVTRTMDQSLRRGGTRAALRQFWTVRNANSLGLTTVGSLPVLIKSDGADVWVANFGSGTISRVRGSDGKLLGTWTGATTAGGILCAMGRVFSITETDPGKLYVLDPTQPAGAVSTVTSSLGGGTSGIAFDGGRIWTSNFSGSVSIVTLNPPGVTNVSTGFNQPIGTLYDGSNIWITDEGDNTLKKLDSSGNILLSVNVGSSPFHPAFDGTNIWVPNRSGASVTVVRATGVFSGTVLSTLTGNGLNGPYQVAFDGERMLVTNNAGNTVSLWKSSDLTPITTFFTGTDTQPIGACSDGVNFWIALQGTNQLARF